MINFAVYTILVYLFRPFTRSYINTPRLIASFITMVLNILIIYKIRIRIIQVICGYFALLFLCNVIRRIYYAVMQGGWLKCNVDMHDANYILNTQDFCKAVVKYCNTLPAGELLNESLYNLYNAKSEKINSYIGFAIFNAIEKLNTGEICKNDLKTICEKTNKNIHKAIITGNCYPHYFNEDLPQEIRNFVLLKTI